MKDSITVNVDIVFIRELGNHPITESDLLDYLRDHHPEYIFGWRLSQNPTGPTFSVLIDDGK